MIPRRGRWFPNYIGNTKHLAGDPMLGNSVSSSISNHMRAHAEPAPTWAWAMARETRQAIAQQDLDTAGDHG